MAQYEAFACNNDSNMYRTEQMFPRLILCIGFSKAMFYCCYPRNYEIMEVFINLYNNPHTISRQNVMLLYIRVFVVLIWPCSRQEREKLDITLDSTVFVFRVMEMQSNHILSKFIQIKWDYLECLNALPSGQDKVYGSRL